MPLGTDIQLLDEGEGLDLDPSFGLVDERACVAQAMAQRIDTPRGGLWYDPLYGCWLARLVNADLNAAEMHRARVEHEREAFEDERVHNVAATIALDPATSSLRLRLDLEDDAGPFELVLGVANLTVKLLSETT